MFRYWITLPAMWRRELQFRRELTQAVNEFAFGDCEPEPIAKEKQECGLIDKCPDNPVCACACAHYGKCYPETTFPENMACDRILNPNEVDSPIPGGWRIGMECFFSHPQKKGLLGCRVVGKIVGYEPETNIIELEYNGVTYRQRHTLEFGGISGAPAENRSLK